MATDRNTRHALSYRFWPDLRSLHTLPRRMVLHRQQSISLWLDSLKQKHRRLSLSLPTTIPPHAPRLQNHTSHLERTHTAHVSSSNPPDALINTTLTNKHNKPPPKPIYSMALPQTPHILHLQPRHSPPILRLRSSTDIPNNLRTLHRRPKSNVSNPPPNPLQSTWNPLKFLLRLAQRYPRQVLLSATTTHSQKNNHFFFFFFFCSFSPQRPDNTNQHNTPLLPLHLALRIPPLGPSTTLESRITRFILRNLWILCWWL